RDELAARYRFHLALQGMLRNLQGRQMAVGQAMQFLSQNRQLAEGDFHEVVRIFRDARKELGKTLKDADEHPLPALRNLEAGKPLGLFLLDEDLVDRLDPDTQSIQGEWIGAFLRQLGEVTDRLRRIHFKSVGGILALQERVEREARKQLPPEPVTPPDA